MNTECRFVIAIHGGAGGVSAQALGPAAAGAAENGLRRALDSGSVVLAGGGDALEAVTRAVAALEDCPLFNAGRGAVLNVRGEHELEAGIMDGAGLRAAGVMGLRRVRNPVHLARALLEDGRAVLLACEAAEALAAERGLERVDPCWFTTPERRAQWDALRPRGRVTLDHDAPGPAGDTPGDRHPGTVGAVALDCHGHLAAATSTGGLANKPAGRVGDSPVIGAGCYADDATVAVSTTGTGEAFLRAVAAHELSALVAHGGLDLDAAAHRLVTEILPRFGGRGGLVAVDRQGQVAMPFNTAGMYRGCAGSNREPGVWID